MPPPLILIHGGSGGVVGTLSVEAGGARRGRVRGGKGEGEGVKRPCSLRLSAFLNREYQQQRRFSRETGDGGHPCWLWQLCLWVLYSHMRPLGLKVLHAGQNLLLVTGQGHTHLRQFTRQ